MFVEATDLAGSRFRRFSDSRVHCPLCSSDNVEYEFILEKSGFFSCHACQLLFASRPPGTKLHDGNASRALPIAEMRATIEAYAGRPVGSIGTFTGSSYAKGSSPFSTIVFTGELGDDDPLDRLRRAVTSLEENGIVALAMPSTTSTSAIRERTRWAALRSRSRYFFNPDNAQLLATRCGLGDFTIFTDARDAVPSPSKELSEWFRSNMLLLARPVERRSTKLLSVIFPVYNEADTVRESLQRVVNKELPAIDIEIIVVESNSTDGSRQIVEEFRSQPRVSIIHEERPRGKGFAVRTGLKHATGDVVLLQDADLEYDVGDYDDLVAPLFALQRNFVLGSRHNPEKSMWKLREFDDQPFVATIANAAHLVLLGMFNTIYKQRLNDPFTMYKVFRRDCLYGLTFECNRFDFDFEITIKLLRKGYRATELPVNYLSRSFAEGKKVSFFGDPPTWVRAMLRLRRSSLYSFPSGESSERKA